MLYCLSSSRHIVPVVAVIQPSVGEWLSLVEHLVRDQGVGGSNPLSPTISNLVISGTCSHTHPTVLNRPVSSLLNNICARRPSAVAPNREEKRSECRVDSTTSEAPLTQGSVPRCLLRCCGSETHLFGRTASLGRVRMYRSHRRCVSWHSDRVGR